MRNCTQIILHHHKVDQMAKGNKGSRKDEASQIYSKIKPKGKNDPRMRVNRLK
jgi:hypothetical protein